MTRILRAEYPDARLTACDIDQDGVDFCAETFGAKPVHGHERPQDMELSDTFDLIWCGSLLTHMDRPGWDEFLELFESALVPRGVLLFSITGAHRPTTAGSRVAGQYLESEEKRETVLRDFAETGFGYADYALPDDVRESLSLPRQFGISLASLVGRRPDRATAAPAAGLLEGRWGSQDVIACMRVHEVREDPPRFRVPLGHFQDQLPADRGPELRKGRRPTTSPTR